MTPTGYLGPNWKQNVGNNIGLTFDGILNDSPETGVMLATDKNATQYVVIPADRFNEVLENESIQGWWQDQYRPTEAKTHDRVT